MRRRPLAPFHRLCHPCPMFCFAYGTNMSQPDMARRAPGARALGLGRLDRHRLVVTAAGYLAVKAAPASTVHGVVWRLTPRDLARLDAYEGLAPAATAAAHAHPHQGWRAALLRLPWRRRDARGGASQSPSLRGGRPRPGDGLEPARASTGRASPPRAAWMSRVTPHEPARPSPSRFVRNGRLTVIHHDGTTESFAPASTGRW